jgi:O-methyltransferase involved in polyketide biosynthesis
LVIAEGLLIYLETAIVAALARELAACRNVRWWVFDLASPNLLKGIQRAMKSVLEQAPMRFAPANGVAFFEVLGWKVAEVCSQLRAAVRLRRLPTLLRWAGWFPDPNPRKLGQARWSAVVRLVNGTG